MKELKKVKYIILDIPLIIESKLNRKSDILIYVKTKKSIILKRLKKRGNYNKKIIKILKSQQLKMDKKVNLCDFTINNNLGKKNILKQITEIKNNIKLWK